MCKERKKGENNPGEKPKRIIPARVRPDWGEFENAEERRERRERKKRVPTKPYKR